MGEARRRKQAGDPTFDLPKYERDLMSRKVARVRAKGERQPRLSDPGLPGREGTREGAGFLKSPVIDLTAKRDERTGAPRPARRAKRGARAS